MVDAPLLSSPLHATTLIYSTVADPASEPAPLPDIDMLLSTAIISASMSRIGYDSVSSRSSAPHLSMYIPWARSCRKCWSAPAAAGIPSKLCKSTELCRSGRSL